MTGATLYASLVLVGVTVFGLIAFVIIGTRRKRRNPHGYQWQPEQDYDVVLRGESSMTPGFPTLVPRNKAKNHTGVDDTGNSGKTPLD